MKFVVKKDKKLVEAFESFVGKNFSDFLQTIDHKARLDCKYNNFGNLGGFNGLAHDVSWNVANAKIESIEENPHPYADYRIVVDCQGCPKGLNESLESSGEDGWGQDVENALEDFMNDAEKVIYEVKHGRRGYVIVRGNKVRDLIDTLERLSARLEEAIDWLEEDEQIIDESKKNEELKVSKDNDIGLYPESVWKIADEFFDRCKTDADEMDYSTPSKINNLGETAESVIAEFRSLSNMANDVADRLESNKTRLQEELSQEDIEFNDKYMPRVDIESSDIDYYKYKGKDFAYDKKHSIVMQIFKDDEEVEMMGDDAPWRELEGVGLRRDNWDDKNLRNQYLDEWIMDIEAESAQLADDFMKYEYPYLKDLV